MNWIKRLFPQPGISLSVEIQMKDFVFMNERLKEKEACVVLNFMVNGKFKLSVLTKVEAFDNKRYFRIKNPIVSV